MSDVISGKRCDNRMIGTKMIRFEIEKADLAERLAKLEIRVSELEKKKPVKGKKEVESELE